MLFIETLVEGKFPVRASINTSTKFNTISKSLFNKLEEDYGLEGVIDLIGNEIKGLDLQFPYKGKWRGLVGIEVIDFQIHKNPSFDVVLGLDWLSTHRAEISFDCHAKIAIDGMCIPLIDEELAERVPFWAKKSNYLKSPQFHSNTHRKRRARKSKTKKNKVIFSTVESESDTNSDTSKSSTTSEPECFEKSDWRREINELRQINKAIRERYIKRDETGPPLGAISPK